MRFGKITSKGLHVGETTQDLGASASLALFFLKHKDEVHLVSYFIISFSHLPCLVGLGCRK